MADDNATTPSVIASLLRSIGGWTQPSGRGLFMFNMMTSNISAAALSGVASAYMTAFFLGPGAALGFAVGGCFGYIGSTIYYWHSTQANALQAFDAYPQLMMLHLIRNYRTAGFEKVAMETEDDKRRFRGRLDGELQLRCLLMAAWHTAKPNIEEIADRKEAQLVEKLSCEAEA